MLRYSISDDLPAGNCKKSENIAKSSFCPGLSKGETIYKKSETFRNYNCIWYLIY